MSATSEDKKWNIEIERRKRKVLEEELHRKSELLNIQSCLIFSNIFRITRPSVKKRSISRKTPKYFLGKKISKKSLQEELLEEEKIKAKKQAEIKKQKPPKELVESYSLKLKQY